VKTGSLYKKDTSRQLTQLITRTHDRAVGAATCDGTHRINSIKICSTEDVLVISFGERLNSEGFPGVIHTAFELLVQNQFSTNALNSRSSSEPTPDISTCDEQHTMTESRHRITTSYTLTL
jgi:hypothetical protein